MAPASQALYAVHDAYAFVLWLFLQLCCLQDDNARPTFERIKTDLGDIANKAFNCSAREASQLSRVKSTALLGQMLPAQASLLGQPDCLYLIAFTFYCLVHILYAKSAKSSTFTQSPDKSSTW